MMSAKIATLGLLKTKIFSNKGYDVMICLRSMISNHVTQIILKMWSMCSNYIVDVVDVTKVW